MDYSDEHPEELTPEAIEDLQHRASQLAQGASRIGLHADPEFGIHSAGGRSILVMRFATGDLAWSDQVQNPEKSSLDFEIAKMEHGMADDALEALRRQIEEKRKGDAG